MSDVLLFAPRIITPYSPRLVLVYAGDNDVTDGKAPERVARQFEKLVALVREKVPDVRFGVIAIKPSGSRRAHRGVMSRANELFLEIADRDPRVSFIDVWTPMLDDEGEPRHELFLEDSLHLNNQGYALWRQVIAPYVYEGINTTLAERHEVTEGVTAATR